MSNKADSLKTIFFALSANGAIAIVKSAAAVITGSGSMLAEAIHSFADCGNQLLLLLGIKRAKRPPSPEFPLGHGKEVYFWSFIVALMLFAVGGLFSIYEGIHKLRSPEPLQYPLLALGVLAFSIVAESLSLWGCVREVNKVRGPLSLWRWFHQSRSAELLVVFGEDLAALFGLSLAFVAIAVTWITGDPLYDALGSVAIGALLIVVAAFVATEVKDLLIGQGVEPEVRKEMIAFLEAQSPVERVFNCITLQMGNDVMVAVKAKMQPDIGSLQLIRDINATEAAFKKHFPQVAWLFFEPDITDNND